MTQLHLFTHEFHPFKGGIARYCAAFAEAAARHPSLTVSIDGPRGSSSPTPHPAYHVSPGRNQGSHDPLALFLSSSRIKAVLKSSPASTCLFGEPGAILAYGMSFSKPQMARIFVTLHGSEILRWQKNPCARFLANRTFQDAIAIHCVSRPIADLARDCLPAYADKIRATRNALPEDILTHAQGRKDIALNRAASDRPFQLLSVGRLHPRKGFDQIIRAISQLPEAQRLNIRYTIAGGSPKYNYDEELSALAASLGIQLRLKIAPDDETLRELYAATDLFALTSKPYRKSIEGFGLVYLEAGAYGLPSIAYDTGGVSDAVLDGQTGFLVPPGNVSQLRDRIHGLMTDRSLRLRLGQQAKTYAFSRRWDEVVDETLFQS